MPDLLLEIFSEEIPARMQVRAARELERTVNKALLDAGFMPEGVKAFATPRRLTLAATGLPAKQPDRREEKKGPRVGAPEKAVAGFLNSAGLSSLDECEQREDKKGAFYVAVIDQKGKDTGELIASFVPEIVRGFSWPKSMRWGDGDLRWVRPLHSILCAFNGEVVDFEIGEIKSGDKTAGHRFMAPEEIQTRNFDDYASKLRTARVVLDTDERKEIIANDAATLCRAQGFELVEDEGLLNEVAGLAEWPVAMMGSFDEKFLMLPDEVLTASMRGHQKYFSVRDPKTGRLVNRFICIANIEAPDGGKAMREGYERVLEARLSDGWFLYKQDLKTRLEDRIADLDKVTFFEGLGSVGNKARRVAALAKEIAPAVGADPETAARAAILAKADLVSGMVYEFPELQGVMGGYYAIEEGESADVADAIRDHYKPAGQDDEVPTAPVSVAVALADKIDTLTAFWVIDKKPTGSSDPFALRRAALGVISILLECQIRVALTRTLLRQVLAKSIMLKAVRMRAFGGEAVQAELFVALNREHYREAIYSYIDKYLPNESKLLDVADSITDDLVTFFHDRLKVYFKDKGHRHDAIDAVRTDSGGSLQDDFVLILHKLKALEAFLKTDDGANLAGGYKRAVNILKAEEKKGALPEDLSVNAGKFVEPQEKSFFAALCDAEAKTEKAIATEDFEAAMTALASLRAPVDHFFDKVTVNADDEALRANRLALLNRFRAATATVADFSKLEG
ncbi:MAG: glycine--tRNA ligase subunit beta [Pseudomonadota bacterium]